MKWKPGFYRMYRDHVDGLGYGVKIFWGQGLHVVGLREILRRTSVSFVAGSLRVGDA